MHCNSFFEVEIRFKTKRFCYKQITLQSTINFNIVNKKYKKLHKFRKYFVLLVPTFETKHFCVQCTLRIHVQRSNLQFLQHALVIILFWEKEFSLLVYTIPIIRLMLKLRKRKLVKKQNNYYSPYITKGFTTFICILESLHFYNDSSFFSK